jgi:hypothetical protein
VDEIINETNSITVESIQEIAIEEDDDEIRNNVGKTIDDMIGTVENDDIIDSAKKDLMVEENAEKDPEISVEDKEYDDYMEYVTSPAVQNIMYNLLGEPYYDIDTTMTPVQQFEKYVTTIRNSTFTLLKQTRRKRPVKKKYKELTAY